MWDLKSLMSFFNGEKQAKPHRLCSFDSWTSRSALEAVSVSAIGTSLRTELKNELNNE